jgi:hypothetical protein
MRYPLVKLPQKVELSLFLIREELKCRKLFHTLSKVGLDDCYFRPHFDSLILRSIGLDEDNDEIFNNYFRMMEKRSNKIEADQDSIMKQALKVYQELIVERRRMSNKK